MVWTIPRVIWIDHNVTCTVTIVIWTVDNVICTLTRMVRTDNRVTWTVTSDMDCPAVTWTVARMI